MRDQDQSRRIGCISFFWTQFWFSRCIVKALAMLTAFGSFLFALPMTLNEESVLTELPEFKWLSIIWDLTKPFSTKPSNALNFFLIEVRIELPMYRAPHELLS